VRLIITAADVSLAVPKYHRSSIMAADNDEAF